MIPILPGVYTFSGLLVGRVYAIEGTDGLTLVDAGLSLAPAKVIAQLVRAGYQASDVKRILVTHAHPDHVGGLPDLHRLTGAAVIASSAERATVEGKVPIQSAPPATLSPWMRFMRPPDTTVIGTPVARTVEDGERLDEVMEGLEVVATPGHSMGQIAFWQPERRLLFCGDTLMNLAGLRLPLRPVTVDMPQAKRSIQRIAALQPAIVCFGHGKPLVENTAARLGAFAQKVAPA